MWAPAKFSILSRRAVEAAPASNLLLHMDGADASTTFTDSSASAHTVTANGNAQIDTAQSVFGGASGLFDRVGDYLTLDGSTDFAYAANFTIDFRVRFNSLTKGLDNLIGLISSGPVATVTAYRVEVDLSNKLIWRVGNIAKITSTIAVSTATWYHVAITRSGTDTKMFLDGTQEGSTFTSDTTSYSVAASRPIIAADHGVRNLVDGWLDELRVVKGMAAWTGNFTPPTSAYTS